MCILTLKRMSTLVFTVHTIISVMSPNVAKRDIIGTNKTFKEHNLYWHSDHRVLHFVQSYYLSISFVIFVLNWQMDKEPIVILGGGVWSAERARCSASWRTWLTCDSRAETLLVPSESEEAHRIAGRNERCNWSEKCEGGETRGRLSEVKGSIEEESCNISFTTNTI